MLHFKTELEELRINNLYRLQKCHDNKLLNFGENDYLGLRKNKVISSAIKRSIDENGNGSGASALVTGYFSSHKNVENAISNALNFEDGIFYQSGFTANLSFFKTIIDSKFEIFLDKLCHASIYEGVKNTNAKITRYPHLNIDKLEQDLKKSKISKKIIVTDSVFSMDGDCADISSLIDLSNKYKTLLFIDDAHGFGVYGKNGLGLLEHQDLLKKNKKNLIHLTTFGKSAGITGAVLCANNETIEFLRQKSKDYIYTTAPPPYIADGVLSAFELIMNGSQLRDKLNENIGLFKQSFKFPKLLLNVDGPIQPIMICDNEKVLKIQKKAIQKGIYLSAIRSPTVPKSLSRIRITIGANHTKDEILFLNRILNECIKNEI
jgi:8-amino-7-oxononanoate synthase